MNRRCIFCDNDNYKLSKEHIVAKWLMKELEISKEMMTMGHFNGIGFKLSERKHNASNLVNGLVCEKCNNGWMSELENENTENIINLINCKNPDIVLKNIMGSDSFLT